MNVVSRILSLALCIYLTQASKKHKDCKLFGPSQICAIPKIGACGAPKCFSNYCEFVEHNKCNPEAMYEYYHDDECNALSPVDSDDCSCLKCKKNESKPVCGIPNDSCGRPVTFPNYCWLQSFNCLIPEYSFQYFHEGECYTDLPED